MPLQTLLATAQFGLALGEYMYALSLRSIALRAHAIVVASGFLQTAALVVSAIVRDKHADGHFSFGYGRCPILVEYAGAAILLLVTCSLSLEAALRLKHHSGTHECACSRRLGTCQAGADATFPTALFQGHDRHAATVSSIITHDVSAAFVSAPGARCPCARPCIRGSVPASC